MKNDITTHPEKISLAGQNLINIATAIVIVILSLVLLIGYYVLTGQGEIPILAVAGFGLIELIALVVIITQLRKAGKNLRDSYTTVMNGKQISLSEADFYNELKENSPYGTENKVDVTDKCPACSESIEGNETECSSCGLVFK